VENYTQLSFAEDFWKRPQTICLRDKFALLGGV
jgi:hypothetical protein